jgi:hypothetical protein
MHYTPIGSPQTDRSGIGFVFADRGEVEKVLVTDSVLQRELDIPANEANHEVRTKWKTLDEDTLLLTLYPHMHLRGKSFRYGWKLPDGRHAVPRDVPFYDFNWQNDYVFEQPSLLPRGTQIRGIAVFDNSDENLANPDPDTPVSWGATIVGRNDDWILLPRGLSSCSAPLWIEFRVNLSVSKRFSRFGVSHGFFRDNRG